MLPITFLSDLVTVLQAYSVIDLTLHSEEGKAPVTLNADLGHLRPGVVPKQQPHGRNGPALVRRRERRAVQKL